jgi:DNA-binding IclR family transcriptional regulator
MPQATHAVNHLDEPHTEVLTMPGESVQQGIQSLEVGLGLFRRLHEAGRPLRLAELAELARMAPAKVHRYLVSLIRAEMVQQDARGLYSLGRYALQLGQSGTWYTQALEIAARALRELAHRIGETVFLACWGTTGPRILRVEEAPKPISVRPRTTDDLPLWNSSPGRLFVAYAPASRMEPLLARERAALAEAVGEAEASDRFSTLREMLPKIRERGMAWTANERLPGINSLAAPVFGTQGNLLFTVTAFGLDASFPIEIDGTAAQAIREIAARITIELGGRLTAPPAITASSRPASAVGCAQRCG